MAELAGELSACFVNPQRAVQVASMTEDEHTAAILSCMKNCGLWPSVVKFMQKEKDLAVAAEREACAKLVEENTDYKNSSSEGMAWLSDIAAAIRART